MAGAKKEVKDDSYYRVEGWMRNKLGLKGNRLHIYAIIYSFSKSSKGWYTGSQSYIAEWCGISRGRAIEILKELTEKQLIEKREISYRRGHVCNYRVILSEDKM